MTSSLSSTFIWQPTVSMYTFCVMSRVTVIRRADWVFRQDTGARVRCKGERCRAPGAYAHRLRTAAPPGLKAKGRTGFVFEAPEGRPSVACGRKPQVFWPRSRTPGNIGGMKITIFALALALTYAAFARAADPTPGKPVDTSFLK